MAIEDNSFEPASGASSWQSPENDREEQILDTAEGRSWLSSTGQAGMHALRIGAIAFEYSPGNEALRFGAFAGAIAQTDGPLIPALALGGTTLLVEGASALGASLYIAENRMGQVANKIDSWLPGNMNRAQKALNPQRAAGEKTGVSWMVEAGLALSVGSIGAMEARQRGVATRDIHEIRKHGIFTASWLAGVLAVGGALTAEGVASIDIQSPITWGVGAVLLAGAGAKTVISKLRARHSTQEKAKED